MASLKNAIKKLEKNGFAITNNTNSGIIIANKEDKTRYIIIRRNGGDLSDSIATIQVRKQYCDDDTTTDYFAGVFCRNITQAIRYVDTWN